METRFDEDRADRAQEFFEKLLVHTKSRWARRPFILAPFQRDDIIRPLFGTVTFDQDLEEWVRLYNLAWLEVARKNGKSELMAGIALLLTGADDEEGAEVYGVAKDTDQAGLVFNVAKRMLELSGLGGPPRSGLPFIIYAANRRIVYPATESFYRVIPADALGNLGQDPHGILFDEIIAQPDGGLWDALKTGFGSRGEPLMVAATTAGDDPTSFAQTEHDFSERVAADPAIAPRRFVYIRNVPKGADPRDESKWELGNPAIEGGFLRKQVLRDECHEAFGPKGNARAQRSFMQFRMNQWQEVSVDAPITLEEWTETAGMVDELSLKGRPVFGGLHTAYIDDLVSIAWSFPPKKPEKAWQTIWRFFIPQESMPSLEDRTADYSGGPASLWVKSGHLTVTDGSTIDITRILAQLKTDIATFTVRELAFDPNGAIGIVQPIMEDKLCEVVKVSGVAGGSALNDWVRLVREQQYFHSMNPVMRWQIACLRARETANEVFVIDRKGSHDHVPGPIASELALRRGLVALEQKPRKPARLIRTS